MNEPEQQNQKRPSIWNTAFRPLAGFLLIWLAYLLYQIIMRQ